MTETTTSTGEAAAPHGRSVLLLALAALGIVYGDIGTSPLYALRECFGGEHGVEPTTEHVLGVLSLVFWSLVVIITVKYLFIVMRADNDGEGGILALTALVTPAREGNGGFNRWLLIALGLFGAALLYGDGMITPAISVLSAVEGLEVATPRLEPFLIPITIAILVALFVVQNRGTARIGAVFGPVTLLWFVCLAALGIPAIARAPVVLRAVNPVLGARFLHEEGLHGLRVLGSVFLVTTGGEALYADMGHFGRRPIRLAWFAVAAPGLLLNYFGQGALLVADPGARANPFFRLVPSWGIYPMVALAAAATVIASQAVISGAFSLTRQAVQLGYLPRVGILHTSAEEIGQIYIPRVNWVLLIAAIGLVLGFKSSSRLAAAYGIAVSLTMVLTVLLAFVAMRRLWRWPLPLALAVAGTLLAIDVAFLGANAIKVADGGWFPLAVGALIFTLMTTWRRGRKILAERLAEMTVPLESFLAGLEARGVRRVPGTAVYMTSAASGVPPALIMNTQHNKVLHEQVVMLRVETLKVPHAPAADRVSLEPLGSGFFRVVARYGFVEEPDVPRVLERLREQGLAVDLREATFVVGRETILATERPGMAIWRERLFGAMSRNAQRATAFFRIPSDRVLEVGTVIEL